MSRGYLPLDEGAVCLWFQGVSASGPIGGLCLWDLSLGVITTPSWRYFWTQPLEVPPEAYTLGGAHHSGDPPPEVHLSEHTSSSGGTPVEVAIEAGGTQPTGMHYCYYIL